MTVTRLRQHSINTPTLLLNKEPINRKVNSYKYLGVTLTSDITWSEHITYITTKSRRLLDCYTDSFTGGLIQQLCLGCIICIICVEYAAPTWNPYLTKDIRSLESVQVFALKIRLKLGNTSYCQLLNQSQILVLSANT